MRVAIAAAIVLVAASAGAAHAETFCICDWYKKTAALVQSLVGRDQVADNGVIAPPGHVDPQMALAPPGPRGTLRIIRPPAHPEQR